MLTRDNLFGIYMHLAANLCALCAAFYFENLFISFEESSAYSSIAAFLLYPGISFISKRISGNVLIK